MVYITCLSPFCASPVRICRIYYPGLPQASYVQCGWSTLWQNVKRVLQRYKACVVDLLGLANVDSRERSFILFKLADRV